MSAELSEVKIEEESSVRARNFVMAGNIHDRWDNEWDFSRSALLINISNYIAR